MILYISLWSKFKLIEFFIVYFFLKLFVSKVIFYYKSVLIECNFIFVFLIFYYFIEMEFIRLFIFWFLLNRV